MKSNKFHYSYPLILYFITFEFLLFLFSFQLPIKKEEQRSIFTYTPPSHTKVLLSLLGSLVVEFVKERNVLHKLLYPHYQQSNEFEERIGMPPSYIVVKMIWDDEEENLVNNSIRSNASLITIKSSGKTCNNQNCNLLKINLPLNNKIFCSNKKSLVAHFLLNHLSVMASELKPLHAKDRSHFNAERKQVATPTENNEEICRLLTNNFNIFVVSSAVGVAVIIALKKHNMDLRLQFHETYTFSQRELLCCAAII
jgi:hypothetical protein